MRNTPRRQSGFGALKLTPVGSSQGYPRSHIYKLSPPKHDPTQTSLCLTPAPSGASASSLDQGLSRPWTGRGQQRPKGQGAGPSQPSAGTGREWTQGWPGRLRTRAPRFAGRWSDRNLKRRALQQPRIYRSPWEKGRNARCHLFRTALWPGR